MTNNDRKALLDVLKTVIDRIGLYGTQSGGPLDMATAQTITWGTVADGVLPKTSTNHFTMSASGQILSVSLKCSGLDTNYAYDVIRKYPTGGPQNVAVYDVFKVNTLGLTID